MGLRLITALRSIHRSRPVSAGTRKPVWWEAHTGQQSFDAYAKEHHEEIMRSLDAAALWQDLHTALAERGMEITVEACPSKTGTANVSLTPSRPAHWIENLSRQNLEARLGPYQPPQALENIQERSRYSAAPASFTGARDSFLRNTRQGSPPAKIGCKPSKSRKRPHLPPSGLNGQPSDRNWNAKISPRKPAAAPATCPQA